MKPIFRPGFFGSRRDEKVKKYNKMYGDGKWTLGWKLFEQASEIFEFEQACVFFYESSYYQYLFDKPELIDEICSYGECIDNATSNIGSGTNYMIQEARSTHIQDIAVRNVLRLLGRNFNGPVDKILTIRSSDSNGFKFGPGNIPFFASYNIIQPSLCPSWASNGSVEDFWQSNKFLCLRDK